MALGQMGCPNPQDPIAGYSGDPMFWGEDPKGISFVFMYKK